ncbi:hypothetical protein IV498_03430 [Paenarthrobacter sp. Z7-10]|uniref:sunset domain-containing protein n=1 Tax=Paenarthrobacter sp. Z7-10 TaxID=2787635 RepID=UPI0022A98E3B|nr:hypothetical protein [Paenarthrobacter sp. Z7-10]MCZ2402255.1 hypothetical protein [Paenarthrobacter sp. Z7-10]
MNQFPGLRVRRVPRYALAFTAALALALPMYAAPAAQAAPTVSTRIAGYSAGPAKVALHGAVTLQGQTQRLTGRTWGKAAGTTVTVYFDPDGARPNAAVRTLKASSTGQFRTAFNAAATGRWSVRLPATGTLKSSGTVAVVVTVVVPRPVSSKPVSHWNCPSWAPIKGNASSHIYHLPGQRFYTRTAPEICFATERAAQQGGYRRSKV